MQILEQSQQATIRIGPFLDEDDGKTVETGLTISQADIRLSKNGGDFAQSNDSGGAAHDENGWYYLNLNETDTGTIGRLIVAVHESGALPVWQEYMVLPNNVYDSLIGGTDKLQVHADEMTAGLITATVIATGAIDADAIAGDAITDAKIATGAITNAELADSAGQFLADHFLKRNMATSRASSDGDGTGRMALDALSALRNRRYRSGSTLHVCQEDDSTDAWTAVVTANAALNPIEEVDPS